MSHLRDVANTPKSRKRARSDSASSFGDFSPIGMEDLEALNVLEAKLTQASSPLSRKRKRTTPSLPASSPSKSSPIKAPEITKAIRGPLLDVTAPANNAKPSLSKVPLASIKPTVAKPSTAKGKGKQRRTTPDEFENEFDDLDDLFSEPQPEPEPDYDSWFRPAAGPVPTVVGFVRPSKDPGSGMKLIQPSSAALEAAKKLLAGVEDEDEPKEKAASSTATTRPAPPPFKPPLSKPNPVRTAPAPASASTSTVPLPAIPDSKRVDTVPTTPRPVVSTTSDRSFEFHPSHPASKSSESVTSTTKLETKPIAEQTPVRKATPQPTSDSTTPTPRLLGMRSRPRGPPRSKFATPWKKGAEGPSLTQETPSKPASAGKAHQLRTSLGSTNKAPTSKETPSKEAKYIAPLPYSVFNLNAPQPRKKLSELSVTKRRSVQAAVAAGLPANIGEIDSWMAEYWVFGEGDDKQGHDAAFEAMKKAGCSLVKKEWVLNHWILIVWKLANMTLLWPDTQAPRWTFEEVLNQLLYRYEREINRCQRPAIRLIQERDASPSAAMILCVFDIKYLKEAPKELVLTDGWYKIRASIDATLQKAVSKGKIRAGTKLEIIGARLDAQRKEAKEVLESFDSSSLIISGNGTHLAPWHSKLGFKQRPSIPTLNSLSNEGGIIPFLFLTLYNKLPLEYLETTEEGTMRRDGEEERAVQAEWQKKRAAEKTKLTTAMYKSLEKMESLAERLEGIAGSSLSRVEASEDSPPDDIEAQVEDLIEADDSKSVLKGLKPTTAAWMAVSLRQQYLRQQETMAMDIESELQSSFPARNVRSHRVLLVKDAITRKKPASRTCQILLSDAEAMDSVLVEGKTYMVTNLMPYIPGAWCPEQTFLFTRRDTMWRRVALPKSLIADKA